MAELSAADLEVISKHHLSKSLSQTRAILRTADESFSKAEAIQGNSEFIAPSRPRLLAASVNQLIATLTVHEAASEIRSTSGHLDVLAELQAISGRIWREFTYQTFQPLARLVIKNASDVQIWTAVLELIHSLSHTTPPRSAALSYDGTPVVRSTSSYQGSEQTRQILDAAFKYELRGRVYREVAGFHSKFFHGRAWSAQCQKIYDKVKIRHHDGAWTDFPDPPVQEEVWTWIARLQDEFFPDAPQHYYTTESTKELKDGEAKRQLDIFMKKRTMMTSEHNWSDVILVGEHKRSRQGCNELLLQLSRYMRDIFSSQPTRRFVHGFFLHGTTMELWVFDRSGPYSSGEFDIHGKPELFIRALTGYAFMSDEELGLDTFINKNRKRLSIDIDSDARGKKRKLQLDDKPFVKQRAIVCRGTTCFRTKDRTMVAKLSWTSDKRPPEAEHLEAAQAKGVKGVAKFIGYQRVTSIADLRKDLVFGRPWTIQGSNTIESTSTHSAVSQSLQSLQVSRIGSSSSQSPHPCSDARKRKCPQEDNVASKRSKSDSWATNSRNESRENVSTSLYESNIDQYDNRIFGCLVVSPAGRALTDFRTTRELLTAVRDAIRAHQSLFLTGEILHRDVSENNIIITNPKEANGFTGVLIDLDLAKRVGSGRTGARHQTGTMEFMAIEVLRRVAHTYRHDLESFFYVLLWIFGRRVWERGFRCDKRQQPQRDVLKRWNHGSFEDIAEAKQGHMHADGFDHILNQFPPAFGSIKLLCTRLRQILFPLTKEGKLDLGTPSEPEDLYNRIVSEIDSTLAHERI